MGMAGHPSNADPVADVTGSNCMDSTPTSPNTTTSKKAAVPRFQRATPRRVSTCTGESGRLQRMKVLEQHAKNKEEATNNENSSSERAGDNKHDTSEACQEANDIVSMFKKATKATHSTPRRLKSDGVSNLRHKRQQDQKQKTAELIKSVEHVTNASAPANNNNNAQAPGGTSGAAKNRLLARQLTYNSTALLQAQAGMNTSANVSMNASCADLMSVSCAPDNWTADFDNLQAAAAATKDHRRTAKRESALTSMFERDDNYQNYHTSISSKKDRVKSTKSSLSKTSAHTKNTRASNNSLKSNSLSAKDATAAINRDVTRRGRRSSCPMESTDQDHSYSNSNSKLDSSSSENNSSSKNLSKERGNRRGRRSSAPDSFELQDGSHSEHMDTSSSRNHTMDTSSSRRHTTSSRRVNMDAAHNHMSTSNITSSTRRRPSDARRKAVVAAAICLVLLSCNFLQIHAAINSTGLSFRIYDNGALYGLPMQSGIASAAKLSLAEEGSLSGELFGTITFDRSSRYKFDCQFSGTSTGWVWVNGHVVCDDGNAYGSINKEYDNPLTIRKSNTALAFRAHITGNHTGKDVPSLQVSWTSMYPSSTESSPTLHPFLPEAERLRDEMQRQLSRGWGSWLRTDLQSVVKLPDGAVLRFQLCQRSSDSCLEMAIPDDNSARVGLHAHDRSYVGFHVIYKAANVSMEYTVDDVSNQLQVLATPVSCRSPSQNSTESGKMIVNSSDGDGCSDYELRLSGRYAWFRPGTASVVSNDTLAFETPGLDSFYVKLGTPASSLSGYQMDDERLAKQRVLAAHVVDDSLQIRFQHRGEPIGIYTQNTKVRVPTVLEPTVPSIQKTLRDNKRIEQSRLATTFGDAKAHVAEAIQAAVMWTLIYNPVENNALFMPVSRSPNWNFNDQSGAANPDWMYTIFDWDNLFASLLAGLDPLGKYIAYSNLFQAVKSKTAAGFIPNWSTGGAKSQDRTEPPVGAKVMLEIYGKYNETWPIEVVFDDLLDWNNWFLRKRFLQPAGLIALGSYVEQSQSRRASLGEEQNTMYAARLESGLDNSPMYDGDFFDNTTTHLMQLYDVGMTSMVAQEAYCLAELADIIGRDPSLTSMLQARGDSLKDKIRATFWDNEQGAFANRFPNGTFIHHISPTSFYPMLADAASSEQAVTMVQSWLFNASRFCLTLNGDFTGNNPHHCYWGLPSISSDDPDYLKGWVYWRGFIWGPMAQLVYWSLAPKKTWLSTYQTIIDTKPDVVSQARKALCKQMQSMMMEQWNQRRHICENYHPHKNATECSGTRFYHWGALNGLIGMMEGGFW